MKGNYELMANDMQKEEKSKYKNMCPECDSENVFLSGSCPVCLDCGYSKCG